MKLRSAREAVTRLEKYMHLHESPNDKIRVGTATGFFYQDDKGRVFLITNEHVLRDASLLKASAHIREKKVDLPLWDANGKKLWECLGNEIDVAALKIPEDLLGKLWWYTAEASFKEGDILNTAEIPLGLPVLALGYPLGFCDKDNYYPIVRGATVATLPSWGFKREQCFLIDGRLHPGMSGSPVISYNNSQ